MKLEIEIDCDENEELVAKVLYASNWSPGAHYTEVPWPPSTKMALSKYIRQAKLVIAAQKERSSKSTITPALDAAIQDEIEHGPKDIMK